MSDSDSFISEVSEEVRRDQLYGYVRRYGWIAVACILLLVGGAAWTEFSKARDRSAAESAGDAILAALAQDDTSARADALAEISLEGDAQIVASLLTAASLQEAGELGEARATLDAVATGADVPDLYRDLAALKSAMIDTGDNADARRQTLEALAVPGGTFALLAQEQLAYLDIEAGETDAAVERLQAIAEDAGVTRGLRERAQTLIVALGAEVDLPQGDAGLVTE